MIQFLEFFTLLSSHPSIGIMVALILTIIIGGFWYLSKQLDYVVRETDKNSDEIRKISQSLFGSAEERELNGTGIYQRVEEMDEKLEDHIKRED